MTILFKLIYRVNITSIIIPEYFSIEIDELVLNFIRKYKDLRIVKLILQKNNIFDRHS